MGFLDAEYDVNRYTTELEQAKLQKESAKRYGYYKTADKN